VHTPALVIADPTVLSGVVFVPILVAAAIRPFRMARLPTARDIEERPVVAVQEARAVADVAR
jgi:hypothetical protein